LQYDTFCINKDSQTALPMPTEQHKKNPAQQKKPSHNPLARARDCVSHGARVLLSGMATPPSPSHRGGACVTSQIDPGDGYSKIEPSLENKDHIKKLNYSKSTIEATCNLQQQLLRFM
jgi:hypothetical protein